MTDTITPVEQSVIGLALTDRSNYLALADHLRAEDFGVPAHAHIWRALCDLYRAGEAADVMTVTAVLDKRGSLSVVGGRDYIVDLLLAAGSPENIETYGRMLHAESLRRRMKKVGLDIAKNADAAADPFAAHHAAIQSVMEIEYGRGPQFRATADVLSDYEAELYERFEKPVAVAGIPTGFGDLDKLIGGYKVGVHIIAGRTSMGKTALMLSGVYNMVDKHGVRVAIISIEMLERDLTNRLLAIRSGVPTYKLEHGQLDNVRYSAEEKDRVREAVNWLKRVPIMINAHPAPTTSDVRVSLQRLLASTGADVAFIDHIHLMSDDDMTKGRRESLVQQFTNISRNLKEVAKDLQLPLGVLAQLSRAGAASGDRRPELVHLRESGSLEQDAQRVLLLHLEDYYHRHDPKYVPTHLAEVDVAKDQLGGRTGILSLYFWQKTARFYELTAKHP